MGDKKVLNGFVNVPTEIELHPVSVLELVSTCSKAVSLENSLRRYRAAEAELFGNNVIPQSINLDCGLNLLAAFLVGRCKLNPAAS